MKRKNIPVLLETCPDTSRAPAVPPVALETCLDASRCSKWSLLVIRVEGREDGGLPAQTFGLVLVVVVSEKMTCD